jgi:hypothetical protein
MQWFLNLFSAKRRADSVKRKAENQAAASIAAVQFEVDHPELERSDAWVHHRDDIGFYVAVAYKIGMPTRPFLYLMYRVRDPVEAVRAPSLSSAVYF